MIKNNYLNTAILCALLAPATHAAAFTITTFDCVSGGTTQPLGINASGEVTGYCVDLSGVSHSFIKNGATITQFDPPGTPSIYPYAESINASGIVTGYYSSNTITNPDYNHGFVYNNGVTTVLSIQNSVTPTNSTIPSSINTSGKVAGFFSDSIPSLSTTFGVMRGFIYDSTTNQYTLLDAIPLSNISNVTSPYNGTSLYYINDNDQVLGSSWSSTSNANFIYSAGSFTFINIPNSTGFSFPRGINNKGEAVGVYTDINNVGHGFLYSGGTVTAIDIPGGTISDIGGINNNSQIAGYYSDAKGAFHGFVLVGTTVTTVDVSGATATIPTGINNNGEVAGYYLDAAGYPHGFVTSAISATQLACTKPAGSKGGLNSKGLITAINGNTITISTKTASVTVNVPTCAKIEWNGGATSFQLGQIFEWNGLLQQDYR